MSASVQVDFDLWEDELLDEPGQHIIRVGAGEVAAVVVLTASIDRTEVTALCGEAFVPVVPTENGGVGVTRVCPACSEVYGAYRAFNPGLRAL